MTNAREKRLHESDTKNRAKKRERIKKAIDAERDALGKAISAEEYKTIRRVADELARERNIPD